MVDYFPYLLAFISGFLVKWVDWIEDERGGKSILKYPLALVYGALIGYIISNALFAEIFLGALIAQIFARKVDTAAHALGFFTAALSVSLFGFPSVSLPMVFYFMVFAFMDEMVFFGALVFLSQHRLFLPISSLPALIWGRWEYLVGIGLFDVGYNLFKAVTDFSCSKKNKARKRR